MVFRSSTLKIHFILAFITLVFTNQLLAEDFYWAKVANGNYNDANNWVDENGNPLNKIPTENDNVFLLNNTEEPLITVNFPAGNTFVAQDLHAEKAVLNFQGTNVNSVNIHIYGNINFDTSVTANYTNNNVNKWEIKGIINSGNVHSIKSGGVDFDDFTFNIEGETLEFGDNFLSSSTFRIYAGTLSAESINLKVGNLFLCFPGYNDTNAL